MSDLNDMQQYLVDEFVEDYQVGHLSRRDAIRRIAAVVGSFFLADTILAACGAGNQPAAESTSAPASTTSASGTTAAPSATAAAGGTTTAPSATTGTSSTAAPSASASPGGQAAATRPPDPSVSVAANDPAIHAEMVQFPGQGATLIGYLARPASNGTFPIVLVCHENRGLTPYIQDVTRRVAKAGYVGLAVDLLSRQGGTAAITDPAAIPGALGNSPPEQLVQDFQSGLRYAQSLPYANKDRVGMVGFCYGGGVTWRVATKTPELRAAVPFYGPPPPLEEIPNIQAAVLAIYGGLDQRIDQSIPSIEAAMQKSNKVYQKIVYDGANHAFHNDTGPSYKPDAAKDAWAKTIAWFDKYLKS